MKIAIVSQFKSPSEGGGESRITFELAKELKSLGHQVLVICPGRETALIFDEDLQLDKITLQSTRSNKNPIANLTKKNLESFYNLILEYSPDVVHSHTNGFLGLIIQIWTTLNDKPFIYTAHETPSKLNEFLSGTVSNNPVSKYTVKLISTTFISNCDGVIALTNLIKKDLEDLGYRGEIFIVPNGRDLKKYLNLKITRNKEIKKLINIGLICKRKNQMYLVKAMKYLPSNYTLNLVGEIGEKDYFNKISKYIKDNKLKNINILGPINHDGIKELLESSDVYVHASTSEVFSLAVLEAIASGTPAVILDEENTSHWVPKDSVSIVPSESDPKTFAYFIRGIVECSSSEYIKRVERGRESIKDYDLRSMTIKTLKAYEVIMQNPVKSQLKKERELRFLKKLNSLLPESRIIKKKDESSKRLYKLDKKTLFIASSTIIISATLFSIIKLRTSLNTKNKN